LVIKKWVTLIVSKQIFWPRNLGWWYIYPRSQMPLVQDNTLQSTEK